MTSLTVSNNENSCNAKSKDSGLLTQQGKSLTQIQAVVSVDVELPVVVGVLAGANLVVFIDEVTADC